MKTPVCGNQAIDAAGITPAEIDAVIVAASNMQRAHPAMAIEVQAAWGLPDSLST